MTVMMMNCHCCIQPGQSWQKQNDALPSKLLWMSRSTEDLGLMNHTPGLQGALQDHFPGAVHGQLP